MQKPKLIKVPEKNTKITDQGLLVKVNDGFYLLVEEKANSKVFTIVVRKVFAYSTACVAAEDEAKNLGLVGDKRNEVLFVFPGRLVTFWHHAMDIQRTEDEELKDYTVVAKIFTVRYIDHVTFFSAEKSAVKAKERVERQYADCQVLFVFPGKHAPCWVKNVDERKENVS